VDLVVEEVEVGLVYHQPDHLVVAVEEVKGL
jgi:hypothetical protein